MMQKKENNMGENSIGEAIRARVRQYLFTDWTDVISATYVSKKDIDITDNNLGILFKKHTGGQEIQLHMFTIFDYGKNISVSNPINIPERIEEDDYSLILGELRFYLQRKGNISEEYDNIFLKNGRRGPAVDLFIYPNAGDIKYIMFLREKEIFDCLNNYSGEAQSSLEKYKNEIEIFTDNIKKEFDHNNKLDIKKMYSKTFYSAPIDGNCIDIQCDGCIL